MRIYLGFWGHSIKTKHKKTGSESRFQIIKLQIRLEANLRIREERTAKYIICSWERVRLLIIVANNRWVIV